MGLTFDAKIWSDDRFQNLLIKVNNRHKAIGMLVDMWLLAERHWIPEQKLIPYDAWKRSELSEHLVDCDFAEATPDGVYVKDSKERFQWWFDGIEQRKTAGRKGGLISAQRKRDSKGRLLPKIIDIQADPSGRLDIQSIQAKSKRIQATRLGALGEKVQADPSEPLAEPSKPKPSISISSSSSNSYKSLSLISHTELTKKEEEPDKKNQLMSPHELQERWSKMFDKGERERKIFFGLLENHGQEVWDHCAQVIEDLLKRGDMNGRAVSSPFGLLRDGENWKLFLERFLNKKNKHQAQTSSGRPIGFDDGDGFLSPVEIKKITGAIIRKIERC